MTVKFNGNVLEMYDSIDKLPITRFTVYNINVLIDAGIGSDLSDFNKNIALISALIDSNRKKAKAQLINFSQNVQLIISKSNPKYNSFIALIKSINGKDVNEADLTDDGIKRIIEDLGKKGLTIGKVKGFLSEVKKKLI